MHILVVFRDNHSTNNTSLVCTYADKFTKIFSPYFLGGLNGKEPISNVERYDVSSGTWRSMAPMIVPRDSFQACVIGGHIYVIGG